MNNSDFHDFLIIQKSLMSFSKSDQAIIAPIIKGMNPSNYQYLSILLLDSAIARPKLVTQYIDFICDQFQDNDLLSTTFVNHIINLASNNDRVGINTINYIINQLLERSIIHQQEIIDKLQADIYFSHILMDNKLILSTNRNVATDAFLQGIDKYSENGWEKHLLLVKKGMNPNPFAEIIFNDDVNSLQNLISGKGMNPNSVIQPSIYDLLSFSNPITLIEYSALSASLKCFKFLLLNGGKITKDIDYYAISGGNEEIIHICEQKGVSHNKPIDLYLSIKYHHMHLFKWLLESEPTENDYKNIMSFSDYEAIDFINEIDYQFNCDSLCKAIEHNQFIIFKAIIEKGVTEFCNAKESIIHSSCSSKNSSFFNFLLDNKNKLNLDFNFSLQNGLTPLHYAIFYIYLEFVEILIELKVNHELETVKGNNCFHFACQSNNIEMVKYIVSVCDKSKIDQMNIDRILYILLI